MSEIPQHLLTLDELEARTDALARDPRVTMTVIGQSRCGRDIRMISVGEGDRNALVVGVPHPNEPVGALTVERMLALFLGENGAKERRGFRWHFVKAIDPEGLRLNEGWLKKPRTFRNYIENFFRPAMARQGEMTFPLDAGGVKFTASVPECLAWQKAFAIARPVLQSSLHHCDFGGAYHLVGRSIPALNDRLDALINESGLTAAPYSATYMKEERLNRSVTRNGTSADSVLQGATAWPCGETSWGYGREIYGAFSVVTEVPLWDDSALRDASSSGLTWGEGFALLRRHFRRAAEIVSRGAGDLRACAETADELEFLAAADESAWAIQSILAQSDRDGETHAANAVITRSEYAEKIIQKLTWIARNSALVHRLAKSILERDPRSVAARTSLDQALGAMGDIVEVVEREASFTPVPLHVMTGLQMGAILASAEALS